jgi:DNA-binding transcriptional MerR regulator
MTIIEAYSAKKAQELCGFESVAMIDYLQRSGVFVPLQKKGQRKGKGRRFEFRDLVVLKALKRLLDSGASVACLKKSLTEFQKLKWSADPATLEDPNGIIRFLVVSGEHVYLRKDAETLIDLSKSGQLAFSFIIDLESIWSELRDGLGLPKLQPEFDLLTA